MSDSDRRLSALNVWSTSPRQTAELLDSALGVTLHENGREDHFSGSSEKVMVFVHPAEEPALELAFVVEDIDRAVGDCEDNGAVVTAAPAEMPYGISVHLQAHSELQLELVQVRPHGAATEEE